MIRGTAILRHPRRRGDLADHRPEIGPGVRRFSARGAVATATRPGISRGVSISSSTARGRSRSERLTAPANPSRGSVSCPGHPKGREARRECLHLPSEIARAKTDERGVATFDWLPPTTAPVFFVPAPRLSHRRLPTCKRTRRGRRSPRDCCGTGRSGAASYGPMGSRPPASW